MNQALMDAVIHSYVSVSISMAPSLENLFETLYYQKFRL